MRHKISYSALFAAFCMVVTTACGKGESGDPVNPPTPPKPGEDRSATTGIDKEFDAATNIFSRNTFLVNDTAMQGFSLDSDGSVWYTQLSSTNPERLYFIKAQPNKGVSPVTANKEYMTLSYCGHGTNTAIEEKGSDRYLWAGTYGSCKKDDKDNKVQYWGGQLVGRVKYEAGKTVKPTDMECFYIGEGRTEAHPSIDAENGLLTINYNDKAYSAFCCFVVYKLSDALTAPLENVTITCTDGFETGKPASTNKISKVVRAHDLTQIKEVARPKFLKQGYGGTGIQYYDWQGYDVHGDRLYYAEGQSNYNLYGSYFSGGVSYAYITVFDTATNKVVEERTQVAVISDKETTSAIGVSATGTLEAEGVKVYGDKMYLGFTARLRVEGNTQHYQNIFVYNAAKR